MNRRLVRLLAPILAAAQLLLGAPAANADAGEVAAAASHSEAGGHCADMRMDGGDSPACPCCPDGSTDMTSCFANCLVSPGALPVIGFIATRHPCDVPVSRVLVHAAALTEPPLKPPPIG